MSSSSSEPCYICHKNLGTRIACSHIFCSACFSQYIEKEIKLRNLIPKCPLSGCKELFEISDFDGLLSPRVYLQWHRQVYGQDGLDLDTVMEGSCRTCLRDNGIQMDCGHFFCSECLNDYMKTELERGETMMKCSVCKELLVDEECEIMVQPRVYSRWRIAVRKRKFAESRVTTTESGQSSKVVPMNETFYCHICMEDVALSTGFIIKPCSHKYCRDCVSQHLKTKITENAAKIRCPDPSCKIGIFEPELCQEILGPDIFDRWCVILCESVIGSKKFYCPFQDCSALLIDDTDRNHRNEAQTTRKSRFFIGFGCFCPIQNMEIPEITTSQCPHCYRLFCARCKVPWHEGLSCEEYSDEKGRDDFIKLQKLAAERSWKRCPHCSFYVEKTEGCRKISCRCGHSFCYVCGSTMSNVGHKCIKCNWEI